MAEPIKGVENKLPEDPGAKKEPVVEKPTDPKDPSPTAGEEKTPEVMALEEARVSLKAAETLIVEQKREIKRLKRGGEDTAENDERIGELEQKIADLHELIEKGRPEEKDAAVEALQASQRKIGELSAALISKNTISKGSGGGGNKDPLAPSPEGPTPLAKTPEEVALLKRRGLDQFGKRIVAPK